MGRFRTKSNSPQRPRTNTTIFPGGIASHDDVSGKRMSEDDQFSTDWPTIQRGAGENENNYRLEMENMSTAELNSYVAMFPWEFQKIIVLHYLSSSSIHVFLMLLVFTNKLACADVIVNALETGPIFTIIQL